MIDPNNPYARGEPAIDPNNPFASPLAEEVRATRVHRTDELLNPWYSMWTRPRETIRQVIETDPRHHVLLVTALGGASDIVDPEVIAGEDMGFAIGMYIAQSVGGAVGAIIGLYLMGWLTKVVAGWFGGVGSALHTRAAMGWGYVPVAWVLPVMILFNIVLLSMPIDAGNQQVVMLTYALAGLFLFVFGIWQLVVTCGAVGEVHQFTGWGAFGVMLLAFVLIMTVVLLIAIPFVIFFSTL